LVQVELVDLGRRDKLIDLDHARAFQRDRIELIRLQLKVFVLSELVAFDYIVGIDLAVGLCIHFLVLYAVAGFLVDLVKTDLVALRGCRKQRDRTRNERELEEAFPVRTRRHGDTLQGDRTLAQRRRLSGCSASDVTDGRHCYWTPLLMDAIVPAQKVTRRVWQLRRMDHARGDLKAAIISGGPAMTGISIEPHASAQNSLQ
jgi:hypothetical protein